MLFKNIMFDIKNGIIKKWYVFIIPFFISICTYIDQNNQIEKINRIDEISVGKTSLGDYLFSLYGGMQEYVPSPASPFIIPIVWLIVFISSSFIVMNYPINDLKKIGTQIIVRGESKSRWWISKCLWNIMMTIIYHVILIFPLSIVALLNKVPCNLTINNNLQRFLFQMPLSEKNETIPISIWLFVLPLFVSITINLVQMLLSFYITPAHSFLLSCVIYISSAYLMNNYFIGNYAMLIRFDKLFINPGIKYHVGYYVLPMLVIGVVIGGTILFKNLDLINGEE